MKTRNKKQRAVKVILSEKQEDQWNKIQLEIRSSKEFAKYVPPSKQPKFFKGIRRCAEKYVHGARMEGENSGKRIKKLREVQQCSAKILEILRDKELSLPLGFLDWWDDYNVALKRRGIKVDTRRVSSPDVHLWAFEPYVSALENLEEWASRHQPPEIDIKRGPQPDYLTRRLALNLVCLFLDLDIHLSNSWWVKSQSEEGSYDGSRTRRSLVNITLVEIASLVKAQKHDPRPLMKRFECLFPSRVNRSDR